ncbi:hypothetical protein [Citrobacter portucalensis]|uniref:hypothetical protein n=1 Tax=Citrobacter portucalensis TaxID=1639133 RepID=UPI001A1CFDCC|nr:hypothetical protein [Citrobacter portucalensis]
MRSYFGKLKEKNRLRRHIASVNWSYHRSELIERLNGICSKINENEKSVSVYPANYNENDFVEGNDSIAVRIMFDYTTIRYHENGQITNDIETGATLVFAHSNVGFDTVFIHPATSKQSGADYKTLIVYHNQKGARFSDRRLEKLVDELCIYHLYTSVLFENNFFLRFRYMLLKLKSFRWTYFDGEKKFKFSSGIYIPLVSLIVSMVALVVAFIAL